jgi:hypothetical protein
MKMNKKMFELLTRTNIPMPPTSHLGSERLKLADLTVVDGSVFLKDEYERAKHVETTDFPDKTGLECFINHVHMPFGGDRESLLSCLNYAVALQRELARLPGERRFQVIVSVAEDDCTVRFHEVRPGENWVTEDLESYAEEAILLLPVDGGRVAHP